MTKFHQHCSMCVCMCLCVCDILMQVRWHEGEALTPKSLPPLHTIDLHKHQSLTTTLIRTITRAVTSVDVVSGSWDTSRLPEPGTRVPWAACGARGSVALSKFLQLTERMPGKQWEVQTLQVCLTESEVGSMAVHPHHCTGHCWFSHSRSVALHSGVAPHRTRVAAYHIRAALAS